MDRTGVIKAPSKSEVSQETVKLCTKAHDVQGGIRSCFTPSEGPLGWNPMVYLNLKETKVMS